MDQKETTLTEQEDTPLVRGIALGTGVLMLGIAGWVAWIFATLARVPIVGGQLMALRANEITILAVLAGLSIVVGFGAWRALRLGAPQGFGPLTTGTAVVIALVATLAAGLLWR
jgi:hypothetical protein